DVLRRRQLKDLPRQADTEGKRAKTDRFLAFLFQFQPVDGRTVPQEHGDVATLVELDDQMLIRPRILRDLGTQHEQRVLPGQRRDRGSAQIDWSSAAPQIFESKPRAKPQWR